MRLPDALMSPLSHSSLSAHASRAPTSSRGHMRSSTSALAPPPAGSVGWTLPSLNQFMTLPNRFHGSRFTPTTHSRESIVSLNLSNNSLGTPTNGPNNLFHLLNHEDEFCDTRSHFVLPQTLHAQDTHEPRCDATTVTNRPEEIDLTVSSSEDEDDIVERTRESNHVIESIQRIPTSGIPQPTCLRWKRRRAGVENNKRARLGSKRHCTVDMRRSTESTNIGMQNNEVVQKFKRQLTCTICLDVLEDITSTICGHIFCAECIRQAIRANGKCPLCQRHLHLKDIHPLFF